MALERVLSNPLTEDEANSLTDEEKDWLRSWNRESEIPGEGSDSDPIVDSLYPNADTGGDDGGEDTKYDDLTNDELREELASRELPTSGNKADLIERLVADDEANDEEDDSDEE